MAYTHTRDRRIALSTRSALTLGGLVGRLSAWNEARRTRNALSKLSAHELDDIGLNRGDIDRLTTFRY